MRRILNDADQNGESDHRHGARERKPSDHDIIGRHAKGQKHEGQEDQGAQDVGNLEHDECRARHSFIEPARPALTGPPRPIALVECFADVVALERERQLGGRGHAEGEDEEKPAESEEGVKRVLEALGSAIRGDDDREGDGAAEDGELDDGGQDLFHPSETGRVGCHGFF